MTRDQELAWLAGLLEGEGSFSRIQERKSAVVIYLGMCDEDVVRRARDVVIGLVGEPLTVTRTRAKRANHNDQFRFRVYSDRARQLMELLRPFMGERRGQKIDQLLEEMKS